MLLLLAGCTSGGSNPQGTPVAVAHPTSVESEPPLSTPPDGSRLDTTSSGLSPTPGGGAILPNPELTPERSPGDGQSAGVPEAIPTPATTRPSSPGTPEMTPPGTPAAGGPRKMTAREVGMAFYPGASFINSGRMESGNAGGTSTVLVSVDLQTKDSFDKVVSFYRGELQGSRKTTLDDKDYHGVVLSEGDRSVTISQTGKGPTTINLVNKNAPH